MGNFSASYKTKAIAAECPCLLYLSKKLTMARKLYHNIAELVQVENEGRPYLRGSEMKGLPRFRNAYIVTENGRISDLGEGTPDNLNSFDEIEDCNGSLVLPSFVDSHTHLIYAANREDEFAMRLEGKSYAEIAAAGGGILNSARKLANSSEQELFEAAQHRLKDLIALGTGAIEVKSGYGLSLEAELKMLRVARRLGEEMDLPLKTTLLGAHAFPEAFKDDHEAYIRIVIDEMIPAAVEEGLADYIDVFCEEGYFNLNESLRIVEAASQYGLEAKLHVNQFTSLGAVKAFVDRGALSLDHLEVMTEEDIACISESNTIATLLPGCSLFLDIPYGPGRSLLDKNAIVALATDLNPGSAPSGNMALMMALACSQMKLKVDEALCAATLNGAAALELSEDIGSLEVGKEANFILCKPGYSSASLAYHFGHNLIKKHIIRGLVRYEAS